MNRPATPADGPTAAAAARPRVPDPVPAVVVIDVWGVPPLRIPGAVMRMATHRVLLRARRGPRFHKLLGTGSGRTFTPRDADLGHWALLTTWASRQEAEAFATGRVTRSWDRAAEEHLRLVLSPVAARGLWSGREPFGRPEPRRTDGPVVSLTRGRVRPSQWRRFWRATRPVSADLAHHEGLLLSFGVGEAPIGLQGTVSLWRDRRSLNEFARRRVAHREVIADSERLGWYAEDLFARFDLLHVEGRYRGVDVAALIDPAGASLGSSR